MTYEHWNDPQHTDLLAAYGLLERVHITLTKPESGMHRDYVKGADNRGITLQAMLAEEVRTAMDRLIPCIPCKFEGIPQRDCDCPDCERYENMPD
jgi:hypothetical protein|tara:strand:- start:157 stop:441 length:285 start_codon:yes stop_codon:yes gene_type:complete